MPRRSKGYHTTVYKKDGQWYARLRILHPDGTSSDHTRRAISRVNGKQIIEEMIQTYAQRGETGIRAEHMTFRELAEAFKRQKLIDAVFDANGRKVAGYKHPDRLANRIDRLVRYFDRQPVADIRHSDIEAYKLHLLQTPTRLKKKDRSIFDVNNQLRTLRQLFNFAKRERWIAESPFAYGDTLINAGDELPRMRPEEDGELERLLDACHGKRAHLRPWIVMAIETALRPGEINRIERRDIDFEKRILTARVRVTKTNRERQVPITELLARELADWLEHVPDEPNALIFGDAKSNKTAWASAKKEAGIVNLQRKDLRKWSTTRLVAALTRIGIADTHAMKITGHTQFKTFQIYVITDQQTVQDAGAALDALRREREEKEIRENETIH